MTEIQSYLFDFHRTPNFFQNWNNKFKVLEMDGTSLNFQLVFSSYGSDNIDECLNGDVIDTSVVTNRYTVDCALKFDATTDIVSIGADVTWSLGSTIVPLKSVFLQHKATGTVMGYSIHMNAFEVTNQVKLEKDTILWSFEDG